MTLICGIPNAGKTTYSSRYTNVIHLDDYHGIYGRVAKIASEADEDVVIEGLYEKVKMRVALIEVCQHHSSKICVWLDTPLATCLEREKSYRRRPPHMVSVFHDCFEPPTYDEGWDEIIRIRQ